MNKRGPDVNIKLSKTGIFFRRDEKQAMQARVHVFGVDGMARFAAMRGEKK